MNNAKNITFTRTSEHMVHVVARLSIYVWKVLVVLLDHLTLVSVFYALYSPLV